MRWRIEWKRTTDLYIHGADKVKVMNHIIKCCIVVLLTGCSGIAAEHVAGNYYLTKTDYSDIELDLSYKLESSGDFLGVVEPVVFATGCNNDFIIVKQHPKKFAETTINKNITNYYIIPLKYKIHDSPDENKFGPLTFEEFLIKRKELKISDNLMFSKVFKKLE